MRTILEYYPYAIAEGEGAGTAYEYYVKARVLKNFFKKTGNPIKMIIAGIPERYGYSLDFMLLADDLGCRTLVLDERGERLENFKKIYEKCNATTFKNLEVREGLFPGASDKSDFFISCEVLQRLEPADQERYFKEFLKIAPGGVIFAPNAENPDHASHSNLRTVSLERLTQLAKLAGGEVFDSGYIDMPPFPPGIKRSDAQRESAGGGGLYSLAFKGIEQWAKLERLFPPNYRKKSAHIVFVAVRKK